MRIGKEREIPSKTHVPKLYVYNECEHSVGRGLSPHLIRSVVKKATRFMVSSCGVGVGRVICLHWGKGVGGLQELRRSGIV